MKRTPLFVALAAVSADKSPLPRMKWTLEHVLVSTTRQNVRCCLPRQCPVGEAPS